MQEVMVTTLFEFSCQHCGQANVHRETHRRAVHPHLVSTRCDHCHKLNWLGNLTGKVVEGDDDCNVGTRDVIRLG